MAQRLAPGQAYAGRRADVAVVNCSVDRETADLLRQYSGGKKLGAFVTRLVREYHGKQQARAALRERLDAVLGEEITAENH